MAPKYKNYVLEIGNSPLKCDIYVVISFVQHIEVDADGKLSLHHLTNLLESVVEEQSGLPQAVVNIYKHEIVHLK